MQKYKETHAPRRQKCIWSRAVRNDEKNGNPNIIFYLGYWHKTKPTCILVYTIRLEKILFKLNAELLPSLWIRK
jgi:outer membrane phospholipase A